MGGWGGGWAPTDIHEMKLVWKYSHWRWYFGLAGFLNVLLCLLCLYRQLRLCWRWEQTLLLSSRTLTSSVIQKHTHTCTHLLCPRSLMITQRWCRYRGRLTGIWCVWKQACTLYQHGSILMDPFPPSPSPLLPPKYCLKQTSVLQADFTFNQFKMLMPVVQGLPYQGYIHVSGGVFVSLSYIPSHLRQPFTHLVSFSAGTYLTHGNIGQWMTWCQWLEPGSSHSWTTRSSVVTCCSMNCPR